MALGAGNQAMLYAEDTLHMLFDKGLPVLLKHHPAQARYHAAKGLENSSNPKCFMVFFYFYVYFVA